MKTMIIYVSSGDCTERAVAELSFQLSGEVFVADLREQHSPAIEAFDKVIIGCSVADNKLNSRIARFYQEQKQVLVQKEIGLFVCCSKDGAAARNLIQDAFPEELHQMAKTEANFRKLIDVREMSMVRRILVKRVPGIRERAANPDVDRISSFALRMDRTWSPFMFLV